jgi:hypothetical protein
VTLVDYNAVVHATYQDFFKDISADDVEGRSRKFQKIQEWCEALPVQGSETRSLKAVATRVIQAKDSLSSVVRFLFLSFALFIYVSSTRHITGATWAILKYSGL